MRHSFLILVIALLGHEAVLAKESKRVLPPKARIEMILDRLIIPKLEFREATLREAVDFLKKKATDLEESDKSPARGVGLPLTLEVKPEPPKKLKIPPKPPSSLPTYATVSPWALFPIGPVGGPNQKEDLAAIMERRVSLSARDISMHDALRYITAQTGTKIWILEDGFHIVPVEEPEPVLTRDFRIPVDFFPAYARQDRIDHTDRVAAMKKDFRQFLVSNGVTLASENTAALNAKATRLTVSAEQAQLDFIEQILKTTRPPCAFPVPGPEVSKVLEYEPGPMQPELVKMETSLRKRMRAIQLPKVTLDNVSIQKAVKVLHDLSVRLDSSGPRKNRGVPITAELPTVREIPEIPSTPEPDPNVIYTATKVSLWDAVETAARLANYRVHLEGSKVRLIQLPPADVLIVRTYLIPPKMAAEWDKSSANVPWLTSNTGPFNSGPSALYIAQSRRIVVRDTEVRQQEVQDKIEAAWRDYYAEKASKR